MTTIILTPLPLALSDERTGEHERQQVAGCVFGGAAIIQHNEGTTR